MADGKGSIQTYPWPLHSYMSQKCPSHDLLQLLLHGINRYNYILYIHVALGRPWQGKLDYQFTAVR